MRPFRGKLAPCPPPTSPDVVVALRAALAAAEARACAAEAEAARAVALASSTDALVASLKLEIAKLQRELYGTRSERKARLLDQLELQLEEPGGDGERGRTGGRAGHREGCGR